MPITVTKTTVFATEWKNAKKRFENNSGGNKKPAQTILGVRQGTGLEAAFKLVDSTWKDAADNPEKQRKFKDAYDKLQDVSDEYRKVVQKDLNKAPSGQYKTALGDLEQDLYTLTVAVKKRQAMSVVAMTVIENTRKAVTKAEVFIKKCATVSNDKKIKTFNDGIQTAARDITTQIGNINKTLDQGYTVGKDQPDDLFRMLTAWANDGRKLPTTANGEEFGRELKTFANAVDGVKDWLADA